MKKKNYSPAEDTEKLKFLKKGTVNGREIKKI